MLIQNERLCDCIGKGGWICYLVCLFTPVLAIWVAAGLGWWRWFSSNSGVVYTRRGRDVK